MSFITYVCFEVVGGLACMPSPNFCPTCEKNRALRSSCLTGDFTISVIHSLSHTSLSGMGGCWGWGAWHPARTGCGAEAVSDNASCWECRQPLVHLFSPLNHCSPNRKLLPRHFIYLSCSPHSFSKVLSLNFKLKVNPVKERMTIMYFRLQRSASTHWNSICLSLKGVQSVSSQFDRAMNCAHDAAILLWQTSTRQNSHQQWVANYAP